MKLHPEPAGDNSRNTGIWYAIGAFLLWGILPLYWKALISIPAFQILGHRIIWSFVFVVILISYYRRWNELKTVLGQPKKIRAVIACAVLVSVNWGIYIWAVNDGHIIDSSLGYYINPLFSVCLGMLVLRERLNFWQWISLFLAAAGVLIITFQYRSIPWIALSLAVSFGLYGLVKKMANIESIISLTLETAILAPFAFAYLLWLEQTGNGALGHSPVWVNLLLIGAGIVTAIPLLWFARATQRVPLTIVGFVQYLTPTMILFLGLFIYHESFTVIHFIGFAFIWCALALFSLSQTKLLQRIQPVKFRERGDLTQIPVNEEL